VSHKPPSASLSTVSRDAAVSAVNRVIYTYKAAAATAAAAARLSVRPVFTLTPFDV